MPGVSSISTTKYDTNSEPVIYSGTETKSSVDPSSPDRTSSGKDSYTPSSPSDNTQTDYTGIIKKQPQSSDTKKSSSDDSDKSDADKVESPGTKRLKPAEKKEVAELKKIDDKVKTHESAHQAAGGSLVRGKSFNYTAGPDGKEYATGGEVQIDMSAVPGDPTATIAKMQQVRRAALAPADPSPQDRSVAQAAQAVEAQAQAEKSDESSAKESARKKSSSAESERAVSAYKKADNKTVIDGLIDMVNDTYGISNLKGLKAKYKSAQTTYSLS